jgi:N-acetylmuramic acid 6-phosphate etherase
MTNDSERGSTSVSEGVPVTGLGATERPNPATEDIDRRTTGEILALMNEADASVPAAVRPVLPQIERVVDEIVARWRRGGRLFYFGAGTSGRLGVLDASECPPTFGSPAELVQGFIAGGDVALRRAVEGAEDSAARGAEDVGAAGVGAQDVVVGLAASGSTPYVAGALQAARERRAFTVSLVCNRGAPLSRLADVAIEVEVGPEVIAGSTRLKAGTAQKLILNMLTTASMIRTGKVFGNLMVDLAATNQKLRRRAQRIVAAVAGIDEPAAGRLLKSTGYRVKPAILMAHRGVSAAEAEARLAAADGILRRAIETVDAVETVETGDAVETVDGPGNPIEGQPR